MVKRTEALRLSAIRMVAFSLAAGALSLNCSVIAQKVEWKDRSRTRDTAAECVALNYVLVHYMNRFGKSSYFTIRIVPDKLSEHHVAVTLAARFPKLRISDGASMNSKRRNNVLTVLSMKRTSPDTIATKMSAKWGPRDGFGLSLVVKRDGGSWTVSKVFGQSEK